MSSPTGISERAAKVKKQLKTWEAGFQVEHGRKPKKDDIENASQAIKDAYQEYSRLKKHGTAKETTETCDVWGAHLNKSALCPKNANQEDNVTYSIHHFTDKLKQNSKYSKTLPTSLKNRNRQRKSSGVQPNKDAEIVKEKSDNTFETPPSAHFGNLSKIKITSTPAGKSFPCSTGVVMKTYNHRKTTVASGWLERCQPAESEPKTHVEEIEKPFVDESCDARHEQELEEWESDLITQDTIGDAKKSVSRLDFTGNLTPRDKIGGSVSKAKSLPSKIVEVCASPGNVKTSQSNAENTGASSRVVQTPPDSTNKVGDSFGVVPTPQNSKNKVGDSSRIVQTPQRSRNKVSKSPGIKKAVKKKRLSENEDSGDDSRPSHPRKRQKVEKSDEYDFMEVDDDKSTGKTENIKDTKSSVEIAGKAKSGCSSKSVGKASLKGANENFVRLNMKRKRYQRKGAVMTGGKYKRQQWKERMKNGGDGGTCFKCGQSGHWARNCNGFKKKKIDWGDDDMKEGEQENGEQEVHEDASPFPTLEEAAKMAQGIQTKPQIKEKKCDNPDVVVNNDDDFSMDFIPPVYEHAKPPPPMQPYFQPTTDGNPIDTPKEVYEALSNMGYSSFRTGQEAAVMRILSGLSTLVVLSTGAGKSLCYQLPAYMYAQKYNCMTLVISPLVSLMDDQVVGLPKCLNGACLHSGMTKAQRTKVVKQILEGKIHVLLISPEALVGGGGSKSGCLPPISQLPPVAFACIDEAHCVSEWSHHFRPSYLRLCKVLKESLGVQCMLGLTATATLATASSVALHLGINNYQRAVVRGASVPHNLHLSVSRDADRDRALVGLLKGDRFCSLDSIIIYCTRREGTERLASLLRTCLPDTPLHEEFHEENETETEKETKTKGKAIGKGKGGKKKPLTVNSVESYHAGKSSSERRRIQNQFMSGQLRIVAATVAFGMGLDKSDVRAIIHFNLPKTFESYVQEIGRAGRDGEPAQCHLFLDPEGHDQRELRRFIYGNSVERNTVKKLVRKVFQKCKCRQIYQRQQQCLGEEFPDDGINYSEISEEQMMLGVNATNDSPQDDNLSHSNNTPHSDSIPQGKKSPHSDSIPQGNKSPHSDSTPQGNKSPHSDSTSDNDNSPHNDNTQEKSSMESTGHENTSPKRLPRLCPGHERALSIDETVENLDMKEEGVATLLCYLELHPQQWLENLQPTTGLCRISCYGGPKQLLSTSKKCPPLAAAIAFDRRKGISHRNDASIEFPVVEVASSMGWDSWPVKKELRQLQWNNEAVSGRPIGGKSGVFVEFSDISFHFRSPGDLTDDELDGVCDFLAGRVKSQEKAELYQLQCVYDSLHSVSFSDYWHCSDDVNTKRSEKLKGMLREYFERQPTDTSGKIGKLTFGQELSSEILNTMQLQEKIENEIQIRQEVRSFICLHHDRDFSGRAIARIFHGIESPCYPAKVWGRDRRYWRCHLDADFNSLIKIANSEILSLR